MLFRHPTENIEFEISDTWLNVLTMNSYSSKDKSFVASSNPEWPTTYVSFSAVKAPTRDPGIVGLNKDRSISLLNAFIQKKIVPPVEVHKPPNSDQLLVRDGYHRYFISIAIGFTLLPVSIRPYFVLEN